MAPRAGTPEGVDGGNGRVVGSVSDQAFACPPGHTSRCSHSDGARPSGRSALRRSGVLLALRFLALPLHAGLLVVLTSASFGEDARLLDLLVEAAQCALERLVLANSDFCQSGFTSSGCSSRPSRSRPRNPTTPVRAPGSVATPPASTDLAARVLRSPVPAARQSRRSVPQAVQAVKRFGGTGAGNSKHPTTAGGVSEALPSASSVNGIGGEPLRKVA